MKRPSSRTRVSTGEAARILGVCDATVRNWRKAGHLAADASRPAAFALGEVQRLKARLLAGDFNRLRARANKTASKRHSPAGRSGGRLAGMLDEFRRLFPDGDGVDVPRAVFAAALRRLEETGEAGLRGDDEGGNGGGIDFEAISWRRPVVRQVMRGWLRRLRGPVPRAPADAVRAFLDGPDGDDPLGALYQSLSSTGAKARAGAHFTPGRIARACLDEWEGRPERFLDPCCGTGRYLLQAARRFDLRPERLHGFDRDPVAVDIARLNLLLHYPDLGVLPDVRCLDSLRDLANGRADCDTNHLLHTVDAIASNPPWGSGEARTRRGTGAAVAASGESFSLFLEKALTLLRPGGRLSFLLPEAVLRVRAHAGIRRRILAEASIEKITLLGRAFREVFTPCLRLDLIRRPAPDGWRVAIASSGAAHAAPQSRFAANPDCAFDIAVTPEDERLLERLYAVPHLTLRGRAEWALGIVTGDNGRRVFEAPRPGTEPILRGRDVFRFAARPPRRHIRYEPEQFQQAAPERLYRAPEKLVYRFVSDRLVFAYDDRGTLTLNSANILIPRLPGMSVKAALAFLNSRVFQYIFVKRFPGRKVLRGDLERLPFPLLDEPVRRRIEQQVEQCLGGDRQPAEELDATVCDAFRLSPEDAARIGGALGRV